MRHIILLCFSFLYLLAEAHIFVYHRFDDQRYKSADTTTAELTKQFEYFKNNGYTVVPLENIVQKLQKNEPIPDKWVALTIDDAYKSFYDNGLPVFKKYGYPFSLYVYVEATNKRYGDYMTWEQIKEASQYGSIGLHSYSHPRLQNLTPDQMIQDTQKAYDLFTQNLGMKPTIYAYPYGEYTNKVKQTLKENFDFEAILNQNTGSINSKTDRFDIPRIALVGDVNLEHKLRYTTFDVQWFEPELFPKDGILKRVHAKVDPKYKKLKLYITGEGWQDVNVVDGIVDHKLNIYLERARTRIMLGPDVFTISNKIINKIKTKEKKDVE
jgi:peptidoglycan/xylan/chitin deacetylase (PgdA/CDA1 family)